MLDDGTLIGAAGILISLIIVAAVMFGLYRTMNPVEIKNGIEVRGEIVEVSDTGTTLNENPQVILQIQFKRIDGISCNAAMKTIVSRLNAALIRPGCRVDIKYDPNRPERIQLIKIFFDNESSSSKVSVENRLSELRVPRDKGLISEEDYIRRKQEILAEI